MSILAAVAVPHPPLIIPEVGLGKEKKIQSTIDSYNSVMEFVASFKPETVVISSPHMESYADYIHVASGSGESGSFSQFGAGAVRIDSVYDEVFIDELCADFKTKNLSAGKLGHKMTELDHATMIPMWFLNKYLQNYKVVRIGISGLDLCEHYRVGQAIAEVASRLKRKTVFIGSGDLSHRLLEDGPYGFDSNGPVFDKGIAESFRESDFFKLLSIPSNVCEGAGECGFRPFVMMAGVLDRKAIDGKLLSYEGPFGVGYAVACFSVTGEDDDNNYLDRFLKAQREQNTKSKESSDEYAYLARASMEHYVKKHSMLQRPEGLSRDLTKKRAAVFVSLKKFGQLRGCIGSLAPTSECVADEIIKFAVNACSYDPRFEPVREEELPFITVSVDVLTEPEKIGSIEELNPKKYGVIVRAGHKSGVLLPDLEGVDTPQEQIRICRRKGNISDDESVELERFEVIRHF
ncbi:MAG: AmmeMemoRadiSam system protein A [Succinivibrio dextrinosolvens]|nr:AmmeMemoRadiSam system protein A [Succinivibrio dextrinosolvens]